jgi:hypothetical protein
VQGNLHRVLHEANDKAGANSKGSIYSRVATLK